MGTFGPERPAWSTPDPSPRATGPNPCFEEPAPSGAWTRVGPPPYGEVTSIAADPVDPDVVYLLGRYGLFKSTDGGATFCSAQSPFPPAYDASIEIDPYDPDVLYVVSEATAYLSPDGGRSWRGLGPADDQGDCTGMRATTDPADPDVLWLRRCSRWYRSQDRGASWRALQPWPGASFASTPRFTGGPEPAVYLHVLDDASGGGRIFESVDGGRVWRPIAATDVDCAAEVFRIDSDPETLLVSPRCGPPRISRDGGRTWSDAHRGLTEPDWFDITDLLERDGRLLAATWGGDLRVSDDGGETWAAPAIPPVTGDTRRLMNAGPLAFSRAEFLKRYQVFERDGALLVLEMTEHDATRHLHPLGDIFHVNLPGAVGAGVVLPSAPDGVLVSTLDGPVRLEDGRITFLDDLDGAERTAPFFLSNAPSAPDLVFATGHVYAEDGTTRQRVRMSPDGGATWTDVLPASSPYELQSGHFVIAAHTLAGPGLYYAAALYPERTLERFLIRSTDGGATWSETELRGAQGEILYVLGIDPADPSRAYFSLGGALYRTLDGGDTFEALPSPPESVSGFFAHPSNPSRLYARARASIQRSEDGGQTWSAAGTLDLTSLFVSPAAPGALWGTALGPDDLNTVYFSDDAGASWTASPTDVPDPSLLANLTAPTSLIVHPTDPERAYLVGPAGIFETRTGGRP